MREAGLEVGLKGELAFRLRGFSVWKGLGFVVAGAGDWTTSATPIITQSSSSFMVEGTSAEAEAVELARRASSS